uniref:Reverse transcriptase domain-containing protein n=1 Tax=Lactuca sativa TaxID=4236 RepID=A0A9R1WB69_LACSA|nr:hypothetical protein LSAT_V11C200053720 [Lactuca sativa]
MISYLFYVDDVSFMGEWSERNIKNLPRILRCFHISSGLQVNFKKSRVFGDRLEEELEAYHRQIHVKTDSVEIENTVIQGQAYSNYDWSRQSTNLLSIDIYTTCLSVRLARKIRRDFLWGDVDGASKIRWVETQQAGQVRTRKSLDSASHGLTRRVVSRVEGPEACELGESIIEQYARIGLRI